MAVLNVVRQSVRSVIRQAVAFLQLPVGFIAWAILCCLRDPKDKKSDEESGDSDIQSSRQSLQSEPWYEGVSEHDVHARLEGQQAHIQVPYQQPSASQVLELEIPTGRSQSADSSIAEIDAKESHSLDTRVPQMHDPSGPRQLVTDQALGENTRGGPKTRNESFVVDPMPHTNQFAGTGYINQVSRRAVTDEPSNDSIATAATAKAGGSEELVKSNRALYSAQLSLKRRSSGSRSSVQSSHKPPQDPSERRQYVSRTGSAASSNGPRVVKHAPVVEPHRPHLVGHQIPQEDEPQKALERVQRIFRDRVDKCSLAEIIDMAGQLNGRIETLALSLFDERQRLVQGTISKKKAAQQTGIPPVIEGMVKKALGQRLHEAIAWPSESELVHEDFSDKMLDAWQVWAASCVHLAMKPLLFGHKLRSGRELAQIYQQMANADPELAGYWHHLLNECHPRELDRHDMDQRPETSIGKLTPLADEHPELYQNLERAYARMYDRGRAQKEYQAISMHWRSALYEYDILSGAGSSSEKRTFDVLCYGIESIFELAGEAAISERMNRPMIGQSIFEVIRFARNLADLFKANYFSANLDVSLVDPQTPFNSSTMDDHGGEDGVVMGTISVGLNEIGLAGEVTKVVMRPKVLLA